MVGNELEAAHQLVSPAKFFTAARRMSFSVLSSFFRASSSTTRPRSRASSSPGSTGTAGPCRPRTGTPATCTHVDRVASVMPRSPAFEEIAAPFSHPAQLDIITAELRRGRLPRHEWIVSPTPTWERDRACPLLGVRSPVRFSRRRGGLARPAVPASTAVCACMLEVRACLRP